MCSSVCGTFLRRVSRRRCTLPFGWIRIGIAISLLFKARAPRTVVEVCSLRWALLEEEDGYVIMPLSTRDAHAKAPLTP
jgi:hypothetical protein